MSLPKIAAPTFELTQPSTGEKLQYRPFLVKEEKILLTARESNDRNDLFRGIKQVINNCITNEGFDVNKIPVFDMEYIFIQLRAKSIDNVVKFQVTDSDDGDVYKLELDLHDVEVQFPEKKHDGIIKINENIGVKMVFPSAEISDHIKNLTSITDITNEMIIRCIEYIFDEDDTFPWAKESRKEQEEFINNLPVDAYNQMQEFFDSSPYIEHTVTYQNRNGDEKKVVFRSLDDFFILD